MSIDTRRQREEVLLSQWFHGENLEDIEKIDPTIFNTHSNVVGWIKKNGMEAFHTEAFAKGIISKELYQQIHSEFYPDMYE